VIFLSQTEFFEITEQIKSIRS